MIITGWDLVGAMLIAAVCGYFAGGLMCEEYAYQGNEPEEFYRTGLARCLWRKQKPKGPQKVEEES
jgi:hypothetical protein